MSNFITSIQKVTETITSYLIETPLTESQVIAKCVPFSTVYRSVSGNGHDNGGMNCVRFRLFDDDGIYLRGNRGYNTGTNSTSYNSYVVEFGSDCKVWQVDVSSWTGTSLDIDTGAELQGSMSDIDKAFCMFYHQTGATSDDYNDICISSYIKDVDTVTLTRGTGGSESISGTLYVVEDTGSNFDVQHVNISFSQQTTNTTLINEVTMAETFLIASHHNNQGDDDLQSAGFRVDLQDSTNVRAVRSAAGTTAATVRVQVVSLTNGNVYRGLTTFTTTSDVEYGSHAAVDAGVSMAWGPTGGRCNGDSYGNSTNGNSIPDSMIQVTLDGDTLGVTLDRLSNQDTTVHTSWETVEWEAVGGAQRYVDEEFATAITTDKEVTKTAVISESSTPTVSTDKTLTKITLVEGSATTAVGTDKTVSRARLAEGVATTAVGTDKTITKDAIVEGLLTTSVTTDKVITKDAVAEGSLATGVVTDKEVTKETDIEGSLTTAVTTDKDVVVVKTAEGSATTGITTDKEITKDAVVEGEATTAVATDKELTKTASVDGEFTTAITTDKLVTKDKEAEGSATTAVATDKSVTKETSIEESSTTDITTDKSVTKVTSVEGSATTVVSTDKEVLVIKLVEGEATTAVSTDKVITKDAVVEGSVTTAVSTDKEVEKLGDLYVDGESTTAITTDKEITKDAVVEKSVTTAVTTTKSVTAIKHVEGSATTGVATSILTSKETNAIGEATTAVLTGKSFTKVTSVEGETTTNIQTDYDVGKGAQGPFSVTIHEVYAKTRLAEVLAKTSIGEVRFKT